MSAVEIKVVGETERRILVVDDQQIILDLLENVLSHEGYRVSTARSSDEAMAELSGGTYDLAITDVDLVRSDGCELMRMIGDESPHTALVVMTGNVEDRVVRFAQEYAEGLLKKPFALERLLVVVRTALAARVEHAQQMRAVSSVCACLQVGAQT